MMTQTTARTTAPQPLGLSRRPSPSEAMFDAFRAQDRPAFIGWGLKDFVFDKHFLAGFRAALPNAEVHAYDDAGHYVLEDKHEVIVPAVRAFLERNPLG